MLCIKRMKLFDARFSEFMNDNFECQGSNY